MKRSYIFGWRYANDPKRHMLYVCRKRHFNGEMGWSVTDNPQDALRFRSVDECIAFWRTRHVIPQQYEHCITDGYLSFFEVPSMQLVIPTVEAAAA